MAHDKTYNKTTIISHPYYDLVRETYKDDRNKPYENYTVQDNYRPEINRYGISVFIEADNRNGVKQVVSWVVSIDGVSDRNATGEFAEFANTLAQISDLVNKIKEYFESNGFAFVRV